MTRPMVRHLGLATSIMAFGVGGCTRSIPSARQLPVEPTREAVGRPAPPSLAEPAPADGPPRPHVTLAADPVPPFTYWAPEGATIRNHPHVAGIWLAFVEGRQVATYFGDGCGAAARQALVGRPVEEIPPASNGPGWRVFEEGTPVNQDLRRDRTNVTFDRHTRRIITVACY